MEKWEFLGALDMGRSCWIFFFFLFGGMFVDLLYVWGCTV